MKNQKSWTGGVRLDILNVTWPLAKLTVTRSNLELKVKFWGRISLSPDQITKIEAVGIIPYVGKRIQIHHTLDPNKYPSKVIFWFFAKETQQIVEELRSWGYGIIEKGERSDKPK